MENKEPVKEFFADGFWDSCLVLVGRSLDTIKVFLTYENRSYLLFNKWTLTKVRLQTMLKPNPGDKLFILVLLTALKTVATEISDSVNGL